MLNLLDYSDYHDAVRTAHKLAQIIKRRRPESCEQVCDLQNIVTRSHQRLDKLRLALNGVRVLKQRNGGDGAHFCNSDLASQVAEELNTLQAALGELVALRHTSPKAAEQAQQSQCAERESSQAPDDILSDSTVMKQRGEELFDALFSN